MPHGFVKEALGGRLIPLFASMGNLPFGLACLRHGKEFSRLLFDLNVSLVHSPASTDLTFVLAEDFLSNGGKPDDPAING
jgi:hypothetical protein